MNAPGYFVFTGWDPEHDWPADLGFGFTGRNFAVKAEDINLTAGRNSGSLADWVVEDGSAGMWEYQKWAGGKAVAWGTVDVVFESPLTYQGLTFVDGPSVSFPFSFAGRPKVQATACADRGLYYVTPTGVTPSSTGFYLRGTCDYASVTVHVDLELRGRWK